MCQEMLLNLSVWQNHSSQRNVFFSYSKEFAILFFLCTNKLFFSNKLQPKIKKLNHFFSSLYRVFFFCCFPYLNALLIIFMLLTLNSEINPNLNFSFALRSFLNIFFSFSNELFFLQ